MNTQPVCPLPHHRDPDRPREAAPGGYLCQGHVDALHRAIAEMPGLYDDLGRRLTAAGAPGERVAGTPDPGLNLNDPVADIRDRIRHTFASWSRLIVEDRGVNPPATAELHATAVFLTIHADWLACQPFADEAAAEITDLRFRAWSLAYPSGRRRFAIADCPECDGTLHATVTAADDLLPSSLDCDTCGRGLTADQWARLGKHHAPAVDLAAYYRVPVGTIRYWASEDRWRRTDTRIRPVLYDTDDAWASYMRRRVGVAS